MLCYSELSLPQPKVLPTAIYSQQLLAALSFSQPAGSEALSSRAMKKGRNGTCMLLSSDEYRVSSGKTGYIKWEIQVKEAAVEGLLSFSPGKVL